MAHSRSTLARAGGASHTAPSEDLPRLVLVYDAESVPPFQLAAAADGIWQPVWAVDRTGIDGEQTLRMLSRLGPVVDITGQDPADAARAIATLDPAGITTFDDHRLVFTAHVAAELGLPFHTVETADALTNKTAQRRALEAAGIAVPRYWEIRLPDDEPRLDDLVDEVGYPAVLKPQSSTASRDTYRVTGPGELRDALHMVTRRSGGEPVGLILEEYLADSWPRQDRPIADYVSVESIASAGHVSHLAVTGKLPLSDPFRETGDFIPATLPPDTTAEVVDLAGHAAKALGVTVGAMHTEIKLTPHGPRIIEVNGRLPGGGIPEAIERVAGYSLLSAVAQAAFGRLAPVDGPLPTNGVAFSYFPQPPTWANTVTAIDGVTDIAELDGVLDVRLNRRPGDRVDWRDGFDQYIVAIKGFTQTRAGLRALLAAIRSTLQVRYS